MKAKSREQIEGGICPDCASERDDTGLCSCDKRVSTKREQAEPTATGYQGFECGCRLELSAAMRADQQIDSAYYIRHCPLHAAAPSLLRAAEAAPESIPACMAGEDFVQAINRVRHWMVDYALWREQLEAAIRASKGDA